MGRVYTSDEDLLPEVILSGGGTDGDEHSLGCLEHKGLDALSMHLSSGPY